MYEVCQKMKDGVCFVSNSRLLKHEIGVFYMGVVGEEFGKEIFYI